MKFLSFPVLFQSMHQCFKFLSIDSAYYIKISDIQPIAFSTTTGSKMCVIIYYTMKREALCRREQNKSKKLFSCFHYEIISAHGSKNTYDLF